MCLTLIGMTLCRAVDNYQNPYDWAYKAIVQKYDESGKKLDHSLDAVDVSTDDR